MTDGDPPPRYASIPVGVSAKSLLRIPVGFVVVVGTLVAGFALAVLFADGDGDAESAIFQTMVVGSLVGGIVLASFVLRTLFPTPRSVVMEIHDDVVRFVHPVGRADRRQESLTNDWIGIEHRASRCVLIHVSGQRVELPNLWDRHRGSLMHPPRGMGVTMLDGYHVPRIVDRRLTMLFKLPQRRGPA